MPYDFSTLSPPEFEDLTHDLLERHYSVELQSFTTGRDRGIDLRHAPVEGTDWIIQCKHFVKSGYSSLLSNLRTKELPKISKLNPGRYILVTSVGLTPQNVDELAELLHPYCKSPTDIIGQSNLNDLLRKHGDIEQSHFKLWLTSEPVLNRLLNNSVFVQSALTIDEIKRRLSLYVHTDSVEKAKARLEQDHVCIIAGIPGIGKTTLAEILLVEYIFNDWQVVTITHHIDEAFDLFRQDEHALQIFYYDDFLGQVSSIEKLGKNEDKSILRLISAIERNPKKRFLLTTREYILAQAKATHEQLHRSDIDLFKYVLECEDYTDIDKARILLNHLFFWDVPQEHIADIVHERKYRDIIDHPHYNPRLIEWMTKPTHVSKCPPNKYAINFITQLDDPWKLWHHAFHQQIGEAARSLLISLATCSPDVFADDLRTCFQAIHSSRAQKHNFSTRSNAFDEALNELEGNFVRLQRVKEGIVISFHNPSVLDFMRRLFHDNPDVLQDALEDAVYFDQMRHLTNLEQEIWDEELNVPAQTVVDAVQRTLMSKSISLQSHRVVQASSQIWSKQRENLWDRLKHCVRLVTHWHDKNLREVVSAYVDDAIDNMDTSATPISGVTNLLEAVIVTECFESEQVEKWIVRCNRFIQECLDIGDAIVCQLEELLAAAEWYSDQLETSDSRAETMRSALVACVIKEVENADEADGVEYVLSELDSFEKYLDEDFSGEIDSLVEWLDEFGPREDDGSYDGGSYSRPSGGSTASIDTMFDAMLE